LTASPAKIPYEEPRGLVQDLCYALQYSIHIARKEAGQRQCNQSFSINQSLPKLAICRWSILDNDGVLVRLMTWQASVSMFGHLTRRVGGNLEILIDKAQVKKSLY
jgi:hypothetical protein